MKRNDRKKREGGKASGWKAFVFFVFLLAAGLAAVFFYLYSGYQGGHAAPQTQAEPEASSHLKMYYPVGGSLQAEDRVVSPAVEGGEDVARAVVEQYLAGPAGLADPAIPSGAKLIGLYFGTNGVLYVDLSQPFKVNFHGDALTEYALLRGLYRSLMSNVPGIDDVMVLIGGRETESIGGHILADRPLGELPAVNTTAVNAAITNAAGGIINGE